MIGMYHHNDACSKIVKLNYLYINNLWFNETLHDVSINDYTGSMHNDSNSITFTFKNTENYDAGINTYYELAFAVKKTSQISNYAMLLRKFENNIATTVWSLNPTSWS